MSALASFSCGTTHLTVDLYHRYFSGRLYFTQTQLELAVTAFRRALNAQREYIQLGEPPSNPRCTTASLLTLDEFLRSHMLLVS